MRIPSSKPPLLPIVWPGVDRDVPSGDGWKGCWTFVRMILQDKKRKKKEKQISAAASPFPWKRGPLHVITISNAAHTLRSGQGFLYLKGERGEKSSLHFWSEWSCKQSMKSHQFTSMISFTDSTWPALISPLSLSLSLPLCLSLSPHHHHTTVEWCGVEWRRVGVFHWPYSSSPSQIKRLCGTKSPHVPMRMRLYRSGLGEKKLGISHTGKQMQIESYKLHVTGKQ